MLLKGIITWEEKDYRIIQSLINLITLGHKKFIKKVTLGRFLEVECEAEEIFEETVIGAD